ncbi:Mu-like prophage major head subunit gpT family protein [Algihabitans albus]|uniref:Mu-like prophage major head subunit gpT family protein n=1 Tax=Algihabitans albus TaxID=2164067 RepID=UPI000E5D9D62|nr:Mu-like prophage major head subunit gpT family protein [Algihabitans albus]
MIINRTNLTNLGVGFKTSFQNGLGQAEAQSDRVATTVTSTTGKEEYGWLGKIPNVREWVGDRVVQNMLQHAYTIRNRSWELTIGVDRDDIEDDNLGVYMPMFEEMGRSTAAHREQLVFELLQNGFTELCYDGQPFFDTDHPVLDESGATVSVANTDGGAGTPWYLIDGSRALRPIIYQQRRAWNFVSKDRPDDDKVFERKEYLYGVDGRSNVGFGFWQFAWGSRQPLSAVTYKLARESLMAMPGDHGRPLGVMPNLLVVPPSLEGAALELLNAERNAAGATNIYRNTAELLVVPWLRS